MKVIKLTTAELVMLARAVAYSQEVRLAIANDLFYVKIADPNDIQIIPVK